MKSEHEMREALKSFLESRNYYVLFPEDLGGRDFYDCIAVGNNSGSVGAIELKLHNPKQAVSQAYSRLYYVNWAAILMPSLKSLETGYRHAKQGNNPWRDRRIGFWHYTGDGINIVREATTGDSKQRDNHTIKMIHHIKFYKEKGVPNEQIWGHERGISLWGLQYPTKTMYGKPLKHIGTKPLETFEEE